MLTADPFSTPVELTEDGFPRRLRARVEALEAEAGESEVGRMLGILEERGREAEWRRDALSTRLMEAFRQHQGRACFGLLYELNGQHLIVQVAGRLRRYGSRADPNDVLQEVFFNIHRYPHRFDAAREDAFRVWSAMIVRNTVLKHLRSQKKGGRTEVAFEDLPEQAEVGAVGPLAGAIEQESRARCLRVYMAYLWLYLRFYSMLSDRERRALRLVEVDGLSYREAAQDLAVKLENLKMIIFRARRKIHRSMRRGFEGLPPDCRPAREPVVVAHRSGRRTIEEARHGT